MSKPRNNLRLFVGAYPPPELAEQMLVLIRAMDLPEHRVTSVERLHLTLQFIGDVPVRDLDATIESVARSASGLARFELVPEKLITLPERGPSRLVALEMDCPPTLLELQNRLAHRFARKARRRAGDRFRPHLTLCRFRRPTRMERIESAVTLASMPVEQIRLMRSILNAAGARHEEVGAFDLEGG